MPDISDALNRAARMRIPVFEPADGSRTKIAALEDYTLKTAFVQGELEEERLGALKTLAELRRRWDHLDGWQDLKRNTRTEAAVQDAKRQCDPRLYDQITDLEWTVKRLSEQVERLERDATKTSRVYSMITGT